MVQSNNWPTGAQKLALGCAALVFAALSVVGNIAYAVENLLGGAEPLSPEVAFIPTVQEVTGDAIVIGFEVADKYYLYRDKMSFKIEESERSLADNLGTEPSLASPIYQSATIIEDDYFGEQSVFRHSTLVTLPYNAGNKSGSINLAVKYQGCADIGLCYPPITSLLQVDLPAGESAAASSISSPISSSVASTAVPISELLGSQDDESEILPPELAYLPQIMKANGSQLDVRWHIEPGYYLYRDKITFSLLEADNTRLISTQIDLGTEQFDQFYGNVHVLRESAEAQLTLESSSAFTGGSEATLQINYQGCADIGVCFPPSVVKLPIAFDQSGNAAADLSMSAILGAAGSSGNFDQSPKTNNSSLSNTTANATANTVVTENTSQRSSGLTKTANSAVPVDQSEQDRLFSMLGSNSLWLNVATFFGLGLLLAFTPCVLPMIPILSSLIVGQGESMNTGKAFRLSLVYVLVMASTYAIVGIFVGLSGYNVQAFLQNPWVLSMIAVLFVALSLSMFGFYELQMPASVQNKLTQWSNKQGGGQVSGVAAMGFISTLIVGPCITAPLAGALIYIAKTGDAFIGGAALFALGLGMGAPLLLIGTSAGKLVPRAGAWMNATKYIFGILMLGMAIYMISRFLPTSIIMCLYGVLAIMSGVHLGATDTVNKDSNGWQRFSKGAGVVVSVYGLALLIGAFSGGNSYTTPLRGVVSASSSASGSTQTHALPFQVVKGIDGLQEAVIRASAEGRPVMLDFYADWCISCKEMEAFTFTDERVQALLKDAIVVQADVTANDSADQALLKHFDLFGPPGIIFYDSDGEEIPAARVVGFMSANKFSDHLERFVDDVGI